MNLAEKEKRKMECESLEELSVMLAETVEQWKVEWMARGKAEGLSESLMRILTKRFGAGNYAIKLQGASFEQLEMWLDRAIDADSVEAVFS